MLIFIINFSIIILQSTIGVSSGQWALTAPLLTIADFYKANFKKLKEINVDAYTDE